MNVKLILVSKEANSRAVSDRLVILEDQINALVGAMGSPSLDQLNLVLCSMSDEPAENAQFAANLAGRRRLAGTNTFGIVVPLAETKFAQTPAQEVATIFLEVAERELLDAAPKMPEDFPTAIIREALRTCLS
jgi:hypothetical protein